jgi:sulfotransferase family protein
MNDAASEPMPLVIGAPRSGTTLLRLMLDAHPLLAIPPETGFLPVVAAIPDDHPPRIQAVFDAITNYPPEHPNWPDHQLDSEAFRRLLFGRPLQSRADACRAFYRAYAARFDKPRWGDKTPGYTAYMPEISELLPEARFIHLVRDGRAVAVSWRRQWFAPGHDIQTLATAWAQAVRQARSATVPYVLEVRYERLVRNPASELERVCGYLDLPFNAQMLAWHKRAAERLDEQAERRRPDGTIVVDLATRRAQQARARNLLDPRLADAWRGEMSPEERAIFERAAGDLLRELGYA